MIIQGKLNCQEKNYLFYNIITNNYQEYRYYKEIWAMGRKEIKERKEYPAHLGKGRSPSKDAAKSFPMLASLWENI
jgi:nuclear transport factor 2 (NTF2) superfamily protein